LTYTDLEKLQKKLSTEEETKVKVERSKHLFKLFETFGQVEQIKDFVLTKGHFFVVFTFAESVKKALESLSKYEERKRLCQEIKVGLEKKAGKQLANLNSPNGHFYVRQVRAIVKGPKDNKRERRKKQQIKSNNPK